ncbi:Bifunctional protein FolD 1 [Abeliophyllum distichum]|uniref:Bifunctional protein FolD 1 n=1 Tax=Abeliophyllum distichum TaxID=126358 RepID=A0ABD1QU34_9LAMI
MCCGLFYFRKESFTIPFVIPSPRITKRFIKFPLLTSIDLPDVLILNAQTFPPVAINSNMKTAIVLIGKSIPNSIKSRIASEIGAMKNSIGKFPRLGRCSCRKRMDSQSFVRIKVKACGVVGIALFMEELPKDCKETDVLQVISTFNENPSVHGIIVQRSSSSTFGRGEDHEIH